MGQRLLRIAFEFVLRLAAVRLGIRCNLLGLPEFNWRIVAFKAYLFVV